MPTWYPTRLIDLSDLKTGDYYTETFRSKYTGIRGSEGRVIKVRLVEREDAGARKAWEGQHYVTLSHRWGAPDGDQPLKLEMATREQLKTGIPLRDLPRTFRDAIELAAHLPGVSYIWIDSLCIIQDCNDDWLKESTRMQQVYSESFLNISATAAENSTQGIYSKRQPKLLWEDDVSLNVEGLPGSRVGSILAKVDRPNVATANASVWLGWTLRWLSLATFKFAGNTFRLGRRANSMPVAKTVAHVDVGNRKLSMSVSDHDYIRRCTVVDASLWETLVNQASVNKRGWVLQERLLAPRVLHFCNGQIAWECSEFDLAEGLPPGLPNFQIRRDDVVPELPVKGLEARRHGKALRANRLQNNPEPDPDLLERDGDVIYGLEIWSRIVEIYSKTDLTFAKDKLVALSGIARKMSGLIGDEYIAGLWSKYLPSQLLWRVEPTFHPATSTFTNPSRRPADYRAPSFSWAAVDAQEGNGIVCGEATDKDILIDIESFHIGHAAAPDEAGMGPPADLPDDGKFGLVSSGHIILWGRLRRIELHRQQGSPDPGRYQWYLRGRPAPAGETAKKLHEECHTNVYLDCPNQDHDFLSAPLAPLAYAANTTTDLYCLPVSRGDRVSHPESRYIICLLLKHVPESREPGFKGDGTYRRIGMTKLSPWADKLAHQHIMTPCQSDADLHHRGYRDSGEHRICLI